MSDTIAAVSTGTQVCAIGIVRMSGSKAIDIADRLFSPVSGRKMADCEDRKLIYGKLCDEQGRLLDICLCTISRAPNSYTGEDTAEFQCHGSPVVLRAVLEAAFSLGARQALPGEFTKRAFLNGRMDLSGAEAVADIIDAERCRSARRSNITPHRRNIRCAHRHKLALSRGARLSRRGYRGLHPRAL